MSAASSRAVQLRVEHLARRDGDVDSRLPGLLLGAGVRVARLAREQDQQR